VPRPSTRSRPLRAARTTRARCRTELDALGGDDRARAREPTCCASRSRRSTALRSPIPAKDDALRAEEAMLADATAIREALAAAYHAVEDDGVDALGAAAGVARRVRRAHRLHRA
jgi:hypothetical protein